MKKYFMLLILLVSTFFGMAVVSPMPWLMPMHHTSSTGQITNKEVLAVWIAINVMCISVIFIRSIIWLFKKSKNSTRYSYWEYSIYSDDLIIPGFNSIVLIVLNIVAVLVLLTVLIVSWL